MAGWVFVLVGVRRSVGSGVGRLRKWRDLTKSVCTLANRHGRIKKQNRFVDLLRYDWDFSSAMICPGSC
jgi:hypothetical protein